MTARGTAVRALLVAGALLAGACGSQPPPDVAFDGARGADAGEPEQVVDGDAPTGDEVTASSGPVWFEVLGVSRDAAGYGTLALATGTGDLAAQWAEHAFDGAPPDVPFDEQVVLVLARPQSSCTDDLVEMRLDGTRLAPTWLPPYRACDGMLVHTAWAVALHRGSLPEAFTAVLREPDALDADADLEVSLPPYDGPPAPAPPAPPLQMTDAEVDAVFAGHPLRRCDELPDWRTAPTVDGPLAADPDVARVQERRADFALPSDEATAVALMADPDADEAFGFPMTVAEFEAVMARNRLDFVEQFRVAYVPAHAAGTFGFLHLDQAAGGEFVAGFTGDLDGHRRRIAEQFPDVPLRVVEAPAGSLELAAAQDALLVLMESGDVPGLMHFGGTPRVEIGLLDPARDDLDRLAAAVDPAVVCVDVARSGLPAGD